MIKALIKYPTKSLFYITFSLNVLIYGLVYFFSKSNFGEPTIPSFFKLGLDLLFLLLFLVYGFKKKLSETQVMYSFFLIVVICIGFMHMFHIGLKEYIHYSIRNTVFYSFFFFLNVFPRIDLKKFEKFHNKLFIFVLSFGLLLFALKTLDIPNPLPFEYWMWEKNRLISTWLNPNSLGFYMMFYLVYYYYKNNRITFISLLIIFTIFLTGSLTAIMGVALFLGYLSLILLAKNKINKKYLIITVLLFPIIVYLGFSFGVFEYVFFKIDILFIQKSKIHTSVSTRTENLYNLYNYLRLDNIHSILLGDFKATEYTRLDSQYLNIFYNYGLLTLCLYIIFLWSLIQTFIKGQSIYSKTLLLFSIWLFLFGFNLTAYLYRSNVLVFYFMMLIYFFQLEKELKIKKDYEKK